MASHNFEQLRARMSAAAKAASAVERRRLVEEMSLPQLREVRELTQTKIADGDMPFVPCGSLQE